MKASKLYLQNFGNDFLASFVVALVAMPLCLGIALASGMPPFSGLIAGAIGGVVVGLLSGSQLSVSGPSNSAIAVVLIAVSAMGDIGMVFLAVAIAGILQIIFGYVKAGIVGDYIPSSVIKGVLVAIGILLVLKQIPHLVGFDSDYFGNESYQSSDHQHNTFTNIWDAINRYVSALPLVIGVLCLVVYVVWENVLAKKVRMLKIIPAPLVVVLLGVGINEWLSNGTTMVLSKDQLVNIPIAENAKDFFGFFKFPNWSKLYSWSVWTTAATIAIVASLETLLNIEAADALDIYKRVTPTNRELKAQGVGNFISGLLGGIPITSVVVRTSVNVNAGGKTKMATIWHGIILFGCVALIPRFLNLIPLAALAAILTYTGYKLAKPALFTKMYRSGLDQFLPFIVTIIAIIFTDLLKGIGIGIGVGLLAILRSNFKSALMIVNDEHKYLIRLRKDISFLNKPILKYKLEAVPKDSSVIIDIRRADFIDKDVIQIINDFLKHAPLKNIKILIKKTPNKYFHKLVNEPILLESTE